MPVPKARSLEELNGTLLAGSKEDERRVIEGRSQTVGAAMNLEREHLLPLATDGFDLAAVYFPLVNASGCVRVLTNFYSAPVAVGVEVQVKVYAAYVEIWHRGKRVARHERCFGRQQKVLDLEHYLDALSKKPGALAGSTPLEQWRAQGRWPACYDQFWDGLKQRQGKQKGTREMIEVLLLGREYGYPQLQQAVARTLELGCSGIATVRFLLNASKLKRESVEAVDIGVLSCYDRPQPGLEHFDRLLRNRPAGEVIQ